MMLLATLKKICTKPELFDPIDQNLGTFNKFSGFKKSVENFKRTLKNFGSSDNQFFGSIGYNLIYHKSEGQITHPNKTVEV